MATALDLTSRKFGRLQAVCDTGERYFSNHLWLCRCECGVAIKVPATKLVSGHTSSCGCLRAELRGKVLRLRPFESIYNTAKRDSVRKRGIAFELTYEDFLEFTKVKQCHYCRRPITWSPFNDMGGYNLDRKDNDLGYIPGNCLVSCGTCNRMKGTMSYNGFLSHIHLIEKERNT